MPQRSAAQRVAWRKLHREASMLRAACLSAALLACAPALAQNYAGTYTATNASGGTVMLTRNAWCSFTYNISGNRNMERLVFTRSGLVKQTPGKQAHWRVQNETLEFSPDGISWSPQPLRLALNASGSAVLQSHDKEYAQCDSL